MTLEEAIERTLAALADLPSGPPSEEILATIQAQAWDEGRKHGARYPYGERGLATDDNPYRSTL